MDITLYNHVRWAPLWHGFSSFVLGEVPFLTMLDDLILTWLDNCYVDRCMIGET